MNQTSADFLKELYDRLIKEETDAVTMRAQASLKTKIATMIQQGILSQKDADQFLASIGIHAPKATKKPTQHTSASSGCGFPTPRSSC